MINQHRLNMSGWVRKAYVQFSMPMPGHKDHVFYELLNHVQSKSHDYQTHLLILELSGLAICQVIPQCPAFSVVFTAFIHILTSSASQIRNLGPPQFLDLPLTMTRLDNVFPEHHQKLDLCKGNLHTFVISIIISSLLSPKSFISLPDIPPNLSHKSLPTGYLYYIMALLSPKPKLETFHSKTIALFLNSFSLTISSSGLCSGIPGLLIMESVAKGNFPLRCILTKLISGANDITSAQNGFQWGLCFCGVFQPSVLLPKFIFTVAPTKLISSCAFHDIIECLNLGNVMVRTKHGKKKDRTLPFSLKVNTL